MSEGSPAVYVLPVALLVGGVLCFTVRREEPLDYVDPPQSESPLDAPVQSGYPTAALAPERVAQADPVPLPISPWDGARPAADDADSPGARWSTPSFDDNPLLTAPVHHEEFLHHHDEHGAVVRTPDTVAHLPSYTRPTAPEPPPAQVHSHGPPHQQHVRLRMPEPAISDAPRARDESRPGPQVVVNEYWTPTPPTHAQSPWQPIAATPYDSPTHRVPAHRVPTYDSRIHHAPIHQTPIHHAPAQDAMLPGASGHPVGERMSSDDAGRRQALQARTLEQARRLIDEGGRLAEKQAFFAAKRSFERSLNMIAQALDTGDGGNRRAQLDAAMVAFEEADDLFAYSQSRRPPSLTHVVIAHDTPAVRKRRDVDTLSYPVAMQLYFTFAQQQLVAALSDSGQASSSLYLLGKLHKVMANQPNVDDNLHGPKSMAFHQAALMIDPNHNLAANELAVLLAGYGEYNSAKQILLQSLRTKPTIEAWHNLAHVHERLQEHELARLAAQEKQRAEQQRRQQAAPVASRDEHGYVRWVAPEQFAKTSGPHSEMAPPATPSAPPARSATERPARQPTSAQPVSTHSWWGPRRP